MIIRHDVPPASYVFDATDWPAVFQLCQGDCAATLVQPDWAITAAHCTDKINPILRNGGTFPVQIAGQENAICEVVIHPSYGEVAQSQTDSRYDLALLRLKHRVSGIEPLKIFSGSDEVGRIVELPGWGDFGNGKRGVFEPFARNDGLFRITKNRITAVNDYFVLFDFEPPGDSKSLPLEGVPGPGDSGGPALAQLNGKKVILGISYGGNYPKLRWYQHRWRIGRYGWREYFVRTSVMKPWIESIVDQS